MGTDWSARIAFDDFSESRDSDTMIHTVWIILYDPWSMDHEACAKVSFRKAIRRSLKKKTTWKWETKTVNWIQFRFFMIFTPPDKSFKTVFHYHVINVSRVPFPSVNYLNYQQFRLEINATSSIPNAPILVPQGQGPPRISGLPILIWTWMTSMLKLCNENTLILLQCFILFVFSFCFFRQR